MHSLTRITTTFQATQTIAWPHFAGSTLRGAFGRALRKATCITGQYKCTGCPLRNSCAYGVVFDPAAPAQPLHPSFRDGLPRYLVQPPALGACQLPAGHTQNFDLLLLPGTQAHHGLIAHTLRNAVEKELFAPGQFQLVHTQVSQASLPAALHHMPGTTTTTKTQPATAHITLRWLTPLRLQQHGKPVFKPQQLDAQGLVRALLRRQMQWQQITDQKPSTPTPSATPEAQDPLHCAQACTLDTRQLQWHEIQRHSGTQNQKLPLGGLIGTATLSGTSAALHTLLPLLQLGEQLHIGKETVMGLGRYRLSD
jgi:CRISPR/Cas system endoribonuclease Cas6 (RAMP superfamily)